MSAQSTGELVKTDEKPTTQNVANCGDSSLTVVYKEPPKYQTSKQKKDLLCLRGKKSCTQSSAHQVSPLSLRFN